MTEYFIVDVRAKMRGKYITLWRPDNAGYCWPLPWAGRYSEEQVCARQDYYTTKVFSHSAPNNDGRAYERYPVPCEVVERIAEQPERGDVDGDAGPVVRNTKKNRDFLLRRRFRAHQSGEVAA